MKYPGHNFLIYEDEAAETLSKEAEQKAKAQTMEFHEAATPRYPSPADQPMEKLEKKSPPDLPTLVRANALILEKGNKIADRLDDTANRLCGPGNFTGGYVSDLPRTFAEELWLQNTGLLELVQRLERTADRLDTVI